MAGNVGQTQHLVNERTGFIKSGTGTCRSLHIFKKCLGIVNVMKKPNKPLLFKIDDLTLTTASKCLIVCSFIIVY